MGGNTETSGAQVNGKKEKPRNHNYETGIAGCLIENEVNGHCPNLSRLLADAPQSFDDQRAGKVAAAVRELRAEQKPVHAAAVLERLKDLPDAATFLQICQADALPLSVAEPEAETVLGFFQNRRIAHVVNMASNELIAATSPKQHAIVLRSLIAEVERLDTTSCNAGLTIRTPSEILAMTFDEQDRILGDRLLAKGQSLVIAGQGGLGKSRLLLQFIAAQRAGLLFIAFDTRGQEMTWLVLQGENSNRRLQQDLASLRAWIGEKYWPQVAAGIHIHTLEQDTDNFLSLDNEQTQGRIRELIAKLKPDGIAWDSLYNFGIGNLSSDEDMTATLLTISRLSKAGNPERAIVVLHHALTGKAGASRATGFDRASFGRNSKVLHQWTRGQINVAPGEPDSNDVLVISCGKCSNGKEFSQFAVRLNLETMIYAPDESFDLSAWQEQVSGKKEAAEPAITPERVAQLCKPAMAKAELVKAIMADCYCERCMAYKHVKKAESRGVIKWHPKAELYNPT
jgi:hypothetical protein